MPKRKFFCRFVANFFGPSFAPSQMSVTWATPPYTRGRSDPPLSCPYIEPAHRSFSHHCALLPDFPANCQFDNWQETLLLRWVPFPARMAAGGAPELRQRGAGSINRPQRASPGSHSAMPIWCPWFGTKKDAGRCCWKACGGLPGGLPAAISLMHSLHWGGGGAWFEDSSSRTFACVSL